MNSDDSYACCLICESMSLSKESMVKRNKDKDGFGTTSQWQHLEHHHKALWKQLKDELNYNKV